MYILIIKNSKSCYMFRDRVTEAQSDLRNMASMYTLAIMVMFMANLLYIRGQEESSSSGIGQPMFSESDVSVNITSNKPNPIRPAGTDVMLNCCVDLSPGVESLMVLQILWIGPDGNVINSITQTNIEDDPLVTGTALIRSFGRNNSGYYTCLANVSFTVTYLNDGSVNVASNMSVLITTGAYITFKDIELANNSAIDITQIAIGDATCNDIEHSTVSDTLVCHTDRPDCCEKVGEWYFQSEGNNDSDGFCVTRTEQGTMTLTRIEDSLFPSFIVLCCNIPDISGMNQTLCVNYDPSISLSGATPIAGENYSLTCNTTREAVINYKWKKNGVELDETGPTFSFSPLRLFHAGLYSCNTAQSDVNAAKELLLTIPGPKSITFTSNKPNPIWPNGSDVTLTCTVELSPIVIESDLPLLMIDAQMSRDGTPLTLAGPTVTGTTYTYTIQLDSFGRNVSGNYTCTATIRRQLNATYLRDNIISITASINLSTGVYLSLNEELLANNSQIPINAIGEGDTEALHCLTDFLHFKNNDINSMEVGEWYFPNKSLVETSGDIYINRGHGVVRLHRKKNITMPNGMFCCEIPDANRTIQNIYVDINYQTRSSSPNMAVSAGAVVSGLLLIAAGIVLAIILCGIKKYRCQQNGHIKCAEDHTRTSDVFQMKQNEIYMIKSELKLNNNNSYGVAPHRACGAYLGLTANTQNQNNDDLHIYEHINN